MTDQTTQAAVDETETQVTPAVEDAGAQGKTDDLDSFLNEYESQTKQPEPTSERKANADLESQVLELRTQLNSFVQSAAEKKNSEDLTNAIKEVRGNLDVQDWMVEGWISHQARTNPKINDVWNNRENDPTAARRLLSSLKTKFAGEQAKSPDRNATEDREAVAAAVRTASSTKAPEEKPPDYAVQNDGEFRQSVKKQYGYDPGV